MPIQKKVTKQVQKFKTLDDMRKFYAKLNEMEGSGEDFELSFNIDYYSEDVCSSIVDVVEKVLIHEEVTLLIDRRRTGWR